MNVAAIDNPGSLLPSVSPSAQQVRALVRAADSLPGGKFDAELAPVLERVGKAILAGQRCGNSDHLALMRLASNGSPRVRTIARNIIAALRPRKPVTNAATLRQIEAIAKQEAAHV